MIPTLIQRVCHRIGYAHNDDGFTLVETLVSFIIFAIVSGAAVAAIVTATKTNVQTRSRVTAASLAQQDLQQVRAVTNRASITAIPATTPVATKVGNTTFSLSRTIDGVCSSGTYGTAIQVTTTVTWPDGPSAGVVMATRLAC